MQVSFGQDCNSCPNKESAESWSLLFYRYVDNIKEREQQEVAVVCAGRIACDGSMDGPSGTVCPIYFEEPVVGVDRTSGLQKFEYPSPGDIDRYPDELQPTEVEPTAS